MIRDAFDKKITAALTPAAIKTMLDGIKKYVDRNSEILLNMDLSQRFSFGDKDRELIYNAISLTEEELEREIKASKFINKTNRNNNNPFYCACMLTMCKLLNTKKEKEASMVMTYMSLMMYTSIHKGLFKYGANKQIMDYTLANLDNSFRILQMTSLFAFLQDNAEITFNTYKDRIKKCDDKDITYVTDALHARTKQKLRKIANAYYENHKNGNYLNAESDEYNDSEYRVADSNSLMVERLATKVYLKLINHQFDDRFIKYSITKSDVSYIKLKTIIDDIIQDDSNNRVKTFISMLIEHYLYTSGKGYEYIGRGEYITFMKSAYASNSTNEQMVYIKSTLDDWINEYSMSAFNQRYGKTAAMGYKKSIYTFMVFIVNHEAKIN